MQTATCPFERAWGGILSNRASSSAQVTMQSQNRKRAPAWTEREAIKPSRLGRNGPNDERSLRLIIWLSVEDDDNDDCFITQQPWSIDAGFQAPPVIQWVTLGGVTIVLAQQTCEFPCKLLLAIKPSQADLLEVSVH
ncbi:hypothetical protein UY3_09444 [Chelonia mydas]|uniref:Uncharacterized protein n=1 Tax=Chelonia mydas TaxID=8469 RepID=M7BD09_CHEMY|nr:hypothetical protein UY3_09444 [Chelonia mydas]